MTAFESGFLDYLSECSLPVKQASYIFERAFEHPAAQELLKLSQDIEASEGNLSTLSAMVQLNSFDAAMHEAFNSLHACK